MMRSWLVAAVGMIGILSAGCSVESLGNLKEQDIEKLERIAHIVKNMGSQARVDLRMGRPTFVGIVNGFVIDWGFELDVALSAEPSRANSGPPPGVVQMNLGDLPPAAEPLPPFVPTKPDGHRLTTSDAKMIVALIPRERVVPKTFVRQTPDTVITKNQPKATRTESRAAEDGKKQLKVIRTESHAVSGGAP